MIVFGKSSSKIGQFDIKGTTCSYCEQENTQHVSMFGTYAHIFWIPVFPIGKKAIVECDHCKRTYDKSKFSPELKKEFYYAKKSVKTPFWHWIGLILVLGIPALLSIFSMFFSEAPDPRSIMLSNDVDRMILAPTVQTDSISYKIKKLFDAFALDEIHPEQFKYFTKIKGDKALILVKIPKLKKIEKKAREDIIDVVELITNTQADLKDKEKYIGIHGRYNFMMLKTPTDKKNSNLVLKEPLYEFYGPKPVVKKE